MPKLRVRAALPHLNKPQTQKPRDDVARLENRRGAHLRDLDGLRADELGFDRWLAILKQHRDHFAEILLQLIQALALTVRARKPGNVPDIEPGFGIAPDDHRVASPEETPSWVPRIRAW